VGGVCSGMDCEFSFLALCLLLIMDKDLAYYVHCFTHLKRDNKNGGAPHKPILLLSIIRLFESGVFKSNEISISPDLVSAFKSSWTKLVITTHHPIFALPFYHMRSEPFWQLIAAPGCEMWIESKGTMRTFGNLKTAVEFARIDQELTELLTQPETRNVLKVSVLDKYFKETKSNYGDFNAEGLPDSSILYESSEEYKRKIVELKKRVDENTFQEEVFIRSGLFKREIPKIYDNTCAISGLRIDATSNISMVDACHIVPFSEGYDDTLVNGISLCPTLHRAFDRGLIALSGKYEVLINHNFVENSSVYNLSQFAGKEIFLPDNSKYYPAAENLRNYRRRFGF